jgi:hypothetical protein
MSDGDKTRNFSDEELSGNPVIDVRIIDEQRA